MSPGRASLLLLVLFCAGTAAIGQPPPQSPPPPPGDLVEMNAEAGMRQPMRKSGACPADVDYPPCRRLLKPLCLSDQDCRGTLKCCFYKCGNQCVLPLAATNGDCPYYDEAACMNPLPRVCRSDKQCPGTDICCYRNCQSQCVPTV